MPNMARWCCCGGCLTLQATISGIDANICCLQQGTSQSVFVDGVAVDGVYQIVPTTNVSFPTCRYREDLESAMMKQYSDTSCGTVSNSTYQLQEYRLDVDIEDGDITSILIRNVNQTLLNSRLFQATGSWPIGSTISNQISACSPEYSGVNINFCDTGTVTIELP